MKAKVIKKFRDKFTKKIYDIGSEFEGKEDRVSGLQKKGYLESSLLDGNVEEVISAINGLDKEELEKLLAEEKQGKNRKTVIEHIESLLAPKAD